MFARVLASRLLPLGRVLLGTSATLASTAAVVTPQKEEQRTEQTAPVTTTSAPLFNTSFINREMKSINALAAQKYGNNDSFAIFSPQTEGEEEEEDDGEIRSIKFSSYMVPEAELKPGQLRLLEVDNKVVVPVNTHIRVLITAKDVLHSWAVPAFGIKMDAIPGRLNQTTLYVKREGVYYGQCSELCGVNHGFMPIVIKAVSPEEYIKWLQAKLENE